MKKLQNKNIIILTIGLLNVIVISLLSIQLIEHQADAQKISTEQVNEQGQKIFVLAHAIVELMDPMEYNDGTLIQIHDGNLPTITIERWNDLSAFQRGQIQAQATADNWRDVTCIVSLCV